MIFTSLSCSAGAFFLPALATSFGVVVLEKTILSPSGEKTALLAPLGREVSCQGSPPVKFRMYIWPGCGLPSFSPARTKARRLLSDDQRGCVSRGPLVRRRGWAFAEDAPSEEVGTAQSEVSYLSSFSFTSTRTNATCEPS